MASCRIDLNSAKTLVVALNQQFSLATLLCGIR